VQSAATHVKEMQIISFYSVAARASPPDCRMRSRRRARAWASERGDDEVGG
jgi:hypothetical protein